MKACLRTLSVLTMVVLLVSISAVLMAQDSGPAYLGVPPIGHGVVQSLIVTSLMPPQMPDAISLLDGGNQAIRNYQSLQYVAEWTDEQRGSRGRFKLSGETEVHYVSPAKSRLNQKIQGRQDSLTVSDGEFIWLYRPGPKLYMKAFAVLGMTKALDGIVSSNLTDFSIKANLYKQAKVTKEAIVKMDGQPRSCWVIEIPISSATTPGAPNPAEGLLTYSIDKELRLIIQSTLSLKFRGAARPYDEVEHKVQIRDLKIDQPIANSLFSFAPPKDAKEVSTLPNFNLPWTNLTGDIPSDFSVKTTEGATYTLSSLKGKTVLLAFGTSWCIPCRNAMPALESLYRDQKDGGLVILRIDVEDNRETVEAFKVTAYPTLVLIDASGKIAAYSIGFREGRLGAIRHQ